MSDPAIAPRPVPTKVSEIPLGASVEVNGYKYSLQERTRYLLAYEDGRAVRTSTGGWAVEHLHLVSPDGLGSIFIARFPHENLPAVTDG